MNVLLVDDEDNLRRFLKVALKSAGFEVVEASNGVEALKLSEKHQIDVLVTDVVMGDMDGLTLAHSLVSLKPELPVVFISGYSMDFEAERRRHPRSVFLPKPFPARVLVKTIASLSGVTS
jgi:CheY-like chemotaxis protein